MMAEGVDPRLAALEAQLEAQQQISRNAQSELLSLTRQELAIAKTHRSPDAQVYASSISWSLEAFMEHFRVLREADFRFYEERDRRYAEVNVEKEKALKIKETADLAALQLAREIQTYKDEKANELREQISSERGAYATKEDLANLAKEFTATLKPIVTYVSSQQGRAQGTHDDSQERHASTGQMLSAAMATFFGLSIVVTIVIAIATHGFH